MENNSIPYRGYTIEPSVSGYWGGFDFYPTAEGRDEDYDWDGDSWRNCGNVQHAATLDEAKDAIWEKVMESTPWHVVKMNGREYPFPWIEDAIRFAVMFDGELMFVANP
jgi:hypothetical protein